ncbi:MAG: hypothetical protein L3J74_10840 [Bacteroidales bacterium]|nr:hypothetical protein [Bacteroidales bacterium]
MVLDSFTVTIVVILTAALISAFSRRVKRDKCLYDFNNDPVILEKTNGEIAGEGILRVENTGLEFIYTDEKQDETTQNILSSYIFYKYEYPQIQALIRFHNRLSDEGKKEREKELRRTYNPSIFKRIKRKIQNIFKTISDSLTELANAMVTQFQKSSSAGAFLKSQDKYLKQINQNIIESVGSAFDPILERYIGHKVVFELIKGEQLLKYSGILKDYTANYIEILDVSYTLKNGTKGKADIIVPQKLGIIRHLGEKADNNKVFSFEDLKKWIKK